MCRRKIIKEKTGHELPILEIERQVAELQNMFYVETQKTLLLSPKDSIEVCILRMSKCINDVRSLIEAAKRYGSIEYVWYSGSTISGAM